MTKNELWAKVNDENFNMLVNLRERWQDEKEYEDIQDYLIAIQKHIPEAFKIYKRPFGIDCQADDGIINISLKISGNYLKLIGKSK